MTAQRWKAQIVVEIPGRNQTTVLVTDSVTEHGIFVRTDAPPPPMTLLRMRLVLPPDDTKLIVHGTVANTVQPCGPHSVPGVEVVFFASGGETHLAWSDFIKHLRAAHPDAIYRPVMLVRELAESGERYAFVDELRASDVTPKGMFLATSQRFAVGSDIRVTVIDPITSTLRSIHCVVRRRVTGARAGIGVEYCNMTPETWAGLGALLHSGEPGEGAPALQAELLVVRAPCVPMMMDTLAGPWSADPPKSAHEDAWSLPPENGWS